MPLSHAYVYEYVIVRLVTCPLLISFEPLSAIEASSLSAARGKRNDVSHVFWLINIRENPLNWVIKRLRRDANGKRVFHAWPPLLFSILTALFYLYHRIRERSTLPRTLLASSITRYTAKSNLVSLSLILSNVFQVSSVWSSLVFSLLYPEIIHSKLTRSGADQKCI